jgi:DNA-binding NarL/FixJ family response regulator
MNVFVVEDSPAVREIMLEQLAELPNVICSGHADNELTAIESLQKIACDILILDIKLKSGTGLGVLRAMEATGWPASPPTRIIFSNFTDRAFRILAQSLGVTHFFDKTQEFPSLLALVSDLASPVR